MFVSRTAAENTAGWDNWAVISITEPDSFFGEAKLLHGWYAVNRSCFHDADPARDCGEPRVLMNDKQAIEIVDYAHAVAPHVEGILVHCKAGISRSAAVAKWIAETFGLPFNHRYESFNKYVYEQLVMAAKVRSRRPEIL